MQLRNLQHDARSLRVELHGCDDETFASMVRRSLTDVAIPAGTRVTVRRNTSAFCNEVLAHRLGLIPLKSRFAEHRPATLVAQGPRVVRSGDIQSEDVEVVDKDLLIVCLAAGEALDLSLHIELGTGKDHARHSAAVASRCARRHASFFPAPPLHTRLPVECTCEATAWGTERCVECAGRKRPLAERHDALVYVLEFETTGSLAPVELLRRGLEHAQAAGAHTAAALRGGVVV